MSGLFRLKRDRNRWQILSFVGLGLLILSSVPLLAGQQKSGLLQSLGVDQNTPPKESKAFQQADDLFRNGQPPAEIDPNINRDRPTNWPAMSSEQLEQARVTLIHQGFSPIQADMILPVTKSP